MRSTRGDSPHGPGASSSTSTIAGVFSILVLTFCAVMLVSAAAPEKHLAVFSTAATYTLPVVQRDGRDYVGLLELLDPLGKVSVKADPPRWRIHYNSILGDFSDGKSRALIQGREAEFAGKFILENGRGLVPLNSLSTLLPRILGGPATLHEESGRLFIGNIAIHFTASVAPDDPSHLNFRFTGPVNPTVASEPGKLRLTFRREPITAPASPVLTFDSKVIPSATYSENNGLAELSISTNVPLSANFGQDGRTITLAPAKSQNQNAALNSSNASPSQAAQPPSAAPTNNIQSPTSASVSTVPRHYFAVVDASHGGDDRGEALSPTLAEKDVTVAFARRLHQELESRGISTLVVRDSDAGISLDDRAALSNTAHAAIYISFHAASNGHGVRIYTALLPYSMEDDSGPFRAWATAQSSSLPLSQAAGTSVATELRKVQVSVRTLSAPLRPLNNLTTAAIAVEVAPPASDVSPLTAPDYQQLIAGAVANGIAAIRPQLGAAP